MDYYLLLNIFSPKIEKKYPITRFWQVPYIMYVYCIVYILVFTTLINVYNLFSLLASDVPRINISGESQCTRTSILRYLYIILTDKWMSDHQSLTFNDNFLLSSLIVF